MELIFLGTGAGVPSKGRNVTAIALTMLNERNSIWLFDCGEATQHQILRSSIKLSKLEKIFITHLHGDHIFGLPGLISSRSFQGGETPLTIYGPAGLESFIRTSLAVSGTHLKYPLDIVEIKDDLVFEDSEFKVTCKELDHGILSYGYRVDEADKTGSLDAAAISALGVKPGPIFKELKDGKTVKLEDGRSINGRDFIGPTKKGRTITIFGDTRATATELELAKNADVIVHEATFGSEMGDMAGEYMHSTTIEAATLAKKADAKQLIITHISSRYTREDNRILVDECRQIFPNTEIATDFAIFEL
ncbi:ribonuclease Z [Listeria weihenstephanensis]|uniref:Ribonuclease Z n=1 Tax=Listeria weihenstephanensis TaxID=1006155 RepID=A0A841Z3L2_9LIST|nr:ribonuclease Z [Listeria weihenstephanensis]MBC1499509.1 ribonuclease Z [Listeria weihenstephanensis]